MYSLLCNVYYLLSEEVKNFLTGLKMYKIFILGTEPTFETQTQPAAPLY